MGDWLGWYDHQHRGIEAPWLDDWYWYDRQARAWYDRQQTTTIALDAETQTCAHDAETCIHSATELTKLEACAQEAQTKASTSLQMALAEAPRTTKVRIALIDDITRFLQYAIDRVGECAADNSGSPELAAAALSAISRAVASCPSGVFWDVLEAAQKCVRDNLVWQTQLQIPLKERDAFCERLRQATGNMDKNVSSQLLMSHSKLVPPHFPDVFLSKTKIEVVLLLLLL
jgi:hypothetical protein